MSWLILSAFLQAGIVHGAPVMYDSPNFVKADFPPVYVTMTVDAEAAPFFAEASVRTDMSMREWDSWLPNQVTYQLGGGVRLGPLTAGWTHTCYHPVSVFMEYDGYKLMPSSEGGVDDFYVRVEIKSR